LHRPISSRERVVRGEEMAEGAGLLIGDDAVLLLMLLVFLLEEKAMILCKSLMMVRARTRRSSKSCLVLIPTLLNHLKNTSR
jgi:hypothetical protein